jgi:hypothetical protein
MKIRTISVLMGLRDGSRDFVKEIYLTEEEKEIVMGLILTLHNGRIKVSEYENFGLGFMLLSNGDERRFRSSAMDVNYNANEENKDFPPLDPEAVALFMPQTTEVANQEVPAE